MCLFWNNLKFYVMKHVSFYNVVRSILVNNHKETVEIIIFSFWMQVGMMYATLLPKPFLESNLWNTYQLSFLNSAKYN